MRGGRGRGEVLRRLREGLLRRREVRQGGLFGRTVSEVCLSVGRAREPERGAVEVVRLPWDVRF